MGYKSLDKIYERFLSDFDKAIQKNDSERAFRLVRLWHETIYEYYEFSSGLARGSGVYIPIRDLRQLTNYQIEICRKIQEFCKS